MKSIRVRVRDVVYKADDFYVLRAEPCSGSSLQYGSLITCKGHLFGIKNIAPGVPLAVSGSWTSHLKFGRQFDFTSWKPWSDSSVGVELFLRHCLGVLNDLQIDAVVDAYGIDTYKVLSEEPNCLLDLPEFDSSLVDSIRVAWSEVCVSSDLSTFFAGHDITSGQIRAIFAAFGGDSGSVLEKDPYRLLELDGFPFSKVDEVALSKGIPITDPKRYEGAVLWVLREAANSGHLYVRRGDMAVQLKELLRTSDVLGVFEEFNLADKLSSAVQRLEVKGVIKIDPFAGAYLAKHYHNERESAKLLARFVTPSKLDVDLGSFLTEYETLHGISLSDAQKEAVGKLTNSRVLTLTGLPGTGKTITVKVFVELFRKTGISFALMAPTGIASKRLAMVTGHLAGTVHRTLRYNGESWGFSEDNKYPVGAVVVDECSMLDQELFFRLLDALEEDTILVFVGDDAQLPSVGPGNVLRELVRCPSIPAVRLTQIFRQAQESDIILNSHRINNGESIVSGGERSDFQLVLSTDDRAIADLIVQMAAKLKERDANFQVLSPKYDGIVGVNNLNDRLREVLNPPSVGKKEFRLGNTLRFREGDRIMVIKNDYNLGVYNGDMGKLVQIRSSCFVIRVHGIGDDGLDVLVEVPRNEVLQKLKLAYAITVHRSQGSEFDTVILPMVRAYGRMLQRNLFYTAVTRAKKRVWVLGDLNSINQAIQNNKVVLRNTWLGEAIKSAVSDCCLSLTDSSTPAPIKADSLAEEQC